MSGCLQEWYQKSRKTKEGKNIVKNQEIIADAAVKAGILTAEEAKLRLDRGEDIPLHTISGWKLRSDCSVKEGEEPMEVKLWKKNEDGRFYLAKSYLYMESQMNFE